MADFTPRAQIQIPKTTQQAVDHGKLIIKSFGLGKVQTLIYEPGIAKLGPSHNKTLQQQQQDQILPAYAGRDEILYNSKLGTPIFTNLVFPSFSYTDANDKLVKVESSTGSLNALVLDTVLITVSQQKNIIKTPIQGRNGTVKEYISDGDYQINIKGVLTGSNGMHPYDEVHQLKQILNAPVAVKAVSRWLQNLDVDSIVVDSYSLPQMEGGMSYQAFEINAISDLPVEILINA